jgi:hypothetical protein
MASYRDSVAKVRAMKKELATYYMEMTPYERRKIEEAIEGEINRARPQVVQGALQEWNAALANHKAVGRAVDEAKRKEAQRWQPDRLNMEFQLARAAFDRSQSVAEAQREYQKALDSNDPAKMRAYSEVFSGAQNKFRDDRLPAHRLAVEASRKAAELQTTPEITAALERGAEVTRQIVELQTEIGAMVSEVGGDSAVVRVLNQAHVHTQYNEDRGGWETSVEIQEAEAVR